jgi:two-component system, OmpR family, phosphate regulon sensor histidine kinase PhoR
MLKRGLKLSYRQKLLLNFSVIFSIFTILVLIFQFEREKKFRISNFEVTLDNITELTHNYIRQNNLLASGNFRRIDSLARIVPGFNIRITLIARDGAVLYDSEVPDAGTMENHLMRPEVQETQKTGVGANIRKSSTTGSSYYYYVRSYPDYYIRTASLYNVQVKDYLHVERIFFLYLLLLFVLVSLALRILTKRVSETITRLKNFAVNLQQGGEPVEQIEFPSDELGIIGSQITSIYRKLNEAKEQLSIEKEKLFSHLNALNEGIAFFTPEKEKILTNQHFIQNLNLISEQSNIVPDQIFEIGELQPISNFIDEQLTRTSQRDHGNPPAKELMLQNNGRYFSIKCMFFADKSFEIVITETTKLEKRRLIKQQMTSNIAHELKTPVTSILGYLETLQQDDVPEETRKLFLNRALAQTLRLTELIGDISSLNKIEEAGENFVFEPVKLREIVDEVHEHLKIKLDTRHIRVNIELSDQMILSGNTSLLYSVFYNLFDNVIKYGGEEIEINLVNYLEDNKFYYFSFANTGNSIDENHLPRIFERFYRIDDGRSRETGGTGLGLSIVKNAVELHQGRITARTYKNGGVEFLFSLRK